MSPPLDWTGRGCGGAARGGGGGVHGDVGSIRGGSGACKGACCGSNVGNLLGDFDVTCIAREQ